MGDGEVAERCQHTWHVPPACAQMNVVSSPLLHWMSSIDPGAGAFGVRFTDAMVPEFCVSFQFSFTKILHFKKKKFIPDSERSHVRTCPSQSPVARAPRFFGDQARP